MMEKNVSSGHRLDPEGSPVTDEADLPTGEASGGNKQGFSTFLSVLIAVGFLLVVLFGVGLLVLQANFG